MKTNENIRCFGNLLFPAIVRQNWGKWQKRQGDVPQSPCIKPICVRGLWSLFSDLLLIDPEWFSFFKRVFKAWWLYSKGLKKADRHSIKGVIIPRDRPYRPHVKNHCKNWRIKYWSSLLSIILSGPCAKTTSSILSTTSSLRNADPTTAVH